MQAAEVETLFTDSDGRYHFARWGRPIVPVVFGVEDETLRVVKGAIEAVVTLAGHRMAETDPELGANLMIFFLRDWADLRQVPGLDRLIPDLGRLCDWLADASANQYRAFRFEPTGAIKAAFVFLRMDDALSSLPAADLALMQAAQVICLWSERAFADLSPLADLGETTILRPDIAGVIRAAYAPVMPVAARDASHALRIAARLG